MRGNRGEIGRKSDRHLRAYVLCKGRLVHASRSTPTGIASPISAVPPPADPVFAAKDDFIRRHKLAIWRFSDHWRQHKPDAFVQGCG